MYCWLPALALSDAPSRLRSTVKVSLHFSFSNFKPCKQVNSRKLQTWSSGAKSSSQSGEGKWDRQTEINNDNLYYSSLLFNLPLITKSERKKEKKNQSACFLEYPKGLTERSPAAYWPKYHFNKRVYYRSVGLQTPTHSLERKKYLHKKNTNIHSHEDNVHDS